jgi:hypothetical protein
VCLLIILHNQKNRSISAEKSRKNFFTTNDNFTDQQKPVNTPLKEQRILDKRLIILCGVNAKKQGHHLLPPFQGIGKNYFML